VSKTLYLESVSGVAGDMFAAAFLDAGLVSLDELNSLVTQLGLEGVIVESETVIRATVRATHLNVKWSNEAWKERFSHKHGHHHHDHSHEHHHHHDDENVVLGDDAARHWHTHYTDVDKLIEVSSLDAAIKELARKIFYLLGEAEADAHGISLDKVAFHEVGTVDSIVDVVMAAYCISKTNADVVVATPIKTGRGVIKIQHGTHPVPPPASIRLLVGLSTAPTPAAITAENIELSTPTGIAILKALSPTFANEMPSGVLLHQGMGAGTKDLGGYPNVFRVSVIESASAAVSLPYETDTVTEIVCNIDDDTGEHIGWMAEQLLKNGALEVWQTPATGKKGRTTVCFSVLAGHDWQQHADWIMRNGTTFGLRHRQWDRLKLKREFESRETANGSVRYKMGFTTEGEKLKEKPEFDDIARLSDR
jgi:uncharacterized protein (TIGR00299 family) protein